MKKKINSRLIGIAILAIFATLFFITVIYYRLLQEQVRSDLAVSAKLLRDTRFFELANNGIEEAGVLTELEELRVTWIGGDGTVLYDNDASAGLLQNHENRPEVQEAFETGTGDAIRRSDTMKINTFYYAVRLDNNTVLRVATDTQSLLAVFLSVSPIIVLIIFLITAICIALSNLLTKQLLRPIGMMVENIENSDYEVSYKELEPLAEIIRTQHTEILSAAKARQDFTANVSHELKTPLTAISGYTQLLEGEMAKDEEKRKHFYREIRKNTDRLLALINDIIKLSELDRKEHEQQFEEIDLYKLAEECMGDLTVNARQREVYISLAGHSCMVCGNKDMLKELIENLAQNAIRYNNTGGKVSITADKINGGTSLIVKDNGIGIPASEQQRIFERFYRVDKSRSKATGGTGLGLAIVKHIVEIHDGKIELDSAPGVGTTITVIF